MVSKSSASSLKSPSRLALIRDGVLLFGMTEWSRAIPHAGHGQEYKMILSKTLYEPRATCAPLFPYFWPI